MLGAQGLASTALYSATSRFSLAWVILGQRRADSLKKQSEKILREKGDKGEKGATSQAFC